MRKVLIANRGEIAVRVARACRDAGLASVAVYASQDLDALHVRAADEAYALDGATPAETYLDIGKIVAVAARSGADAVHPGYGFLAENAAFAQAVLDGGLTWIGPPPAAIVALGDKVKAREIAKRVGAPLAPGTDGPEHPVSEEVSGIDLVREMFRIAAGERLGYDDPELRGHSIEFRINAEDPARGFLPAPGTLSEWKPPSGPGVRLDAGYEAGQTVPQAFDSLLGKLIVTGASRTQAVERARRALAEFTVGGMPTVLPFHRAVVDDPAFAGDPFTVHTRWIETDMTAAFEPQIREPREPAPAEAPRETITVEVSGKRLAVTVPATPSLPASPPTANHGSSERVRAPRSAARRSPGRGGQRSGDSLVTPMQGTIVKLVAGEGTQVSAGDSVVILEAMKMEQPLTAHKDGTVTGLAVEVGQTVATDTEICQIKD